MSPGDFTTMSLFKTKSDPARSLSRETGPYKIVSLFLYNSRLGIHKKNTNIFYSSIRYDLTNDNVSISEDNVVEDLDCPPTADWISRPAPRDLCPRPPLSTLIPLYSPTPAWGTQIVTLPAHNNTPPLYLPS